MNIPIKSSNRFGSVSRRNNSALLAGKQLESDKQLCAYIRMNDKNKIPMQVLESNSTMGQF
uniref:Uncharacterized protein n=1 Tax=Manihot esculenta TaxID=3983 RepID=A0A251KZW6_MANES